MKNKIILFTSFLILLIIVFMPARLISNFIPEKSGITISGLNGTVWSGEINNLQVKGWSLSNISFDTHFFPLITGTFGAEVDILKGDITGHTIFQMKNSKNGELKDTNILTKLSQFEKYIPFKDVELKGELETKQLALNIVESKPVYIIGNTIWNNGAVVFNGMSWELGDFEINWQTSEDGTIQGNILKRENVLEIQGNIIISKQGFLEFNGSISTRVDKSIFNAFLFFADGKPSNGRQGLKFKKKVW